LSRFFVLFVALMAVWLAWSGHFTPLLISMGVLSCLFVVWIARRMRLVDREGVPWEIVPRMLLYLPYLLLEILKANIDVARRILDPRLPIGPAVFRSKALQRTALGRVIYANSITLTPGTVTIGIDDEGVTVHALSPEAEQGVLNDEMNRRVARVEGRP
jgi:multicomponent Na+:H+ antiporter subunit E